MSVLSATDVLSILLEGIALGEVPVPNSPFVLLILSDTTGAWAALI